MLYHLLRCRSLRRVTALHSLAPCVQVGPQPGQRLLAQPSALLGVEFVGIRPLTRRGQGRGAGGVITMESFPVISELRIGGERLSVEPGGGGVPAL